MAKHHTPPGEGVTLERRLRLDVALNCLELNLTQLGALVGRRRETCSRWSNGRSPVPLKVLAKVEALVPGYTEIALAKQATARGGKGKGKR